MWYANVNVLLCVLNIRYVVNVNSVSKWGSLLSVCTNIHIIGIIHPPRPCVNDRDPTLVWPAMTRGPNVCVFVVVFVCFKADHIFYLNWPSLNFCGIYWDRRRVGLPTSRARARVRRLTPHRPVPKGFEPWTYGPKVQHPTPEECVSVNVRSEPDFYWGNSPVIFKGQNPGGETFPTFTSGGYTHVTYAY